MSEKIIIGGVNVAECEYINALDKKIKCVILQDDVCEIKPYCESYDCYYKQLKRLQAENERLKVELKSQQMINLKQQDIAQDYWNALEEIKNIANVIINGQHITDDIEGHLKDIVKNHILTKISEVLDERN